MLSVYIQQNQRIVRMATSVYKPILDWTIERVALNAKVALGSTRRQGQNGGCCLRE